MGKLSRSMPASRSRFFVVLAAVLAIGFGPANLSAQSEIKISGQVLDLNSGSPIPGAVVSVEETGKVAISDQSGRFQFSDIPTGRYSLRAARLGYAESPPQVAEVGEYSPARVSIYLPQKPVTVTGQTVFSDTPALRISSHGNSIIVEIGAGSLEMAEIVRHLPELELVNSGPSRYLRLRGSQAGGVVILLDGRPQNSALTSEGDISSIPLGSVRRIEIVKGGGFDSEGLSGSVNFITRTPLSESALASSAERGSFGWESYSATLDQPIGPDLRAGAFAAAASYRGDYEFVDPRDSVETRENNHSHDINLLGKIEYSPGRTGIDISGRYFRRRAGVPGPVFQETPLARASALEREIYARMQTGLGDAISVSLLGGVTSRIGDYDSPRTPTSFIPYQTRYEEWARDIKLGLQARGRFDFDSFFSLRYDALEGTDYIRPESSFGRRSRFVNAMGIGLGFQLHEMPLSRVTILNLGLRREGGDGGDFWGPSATLRLNLDLPLSPGIDLSAYRSRRLPNLTDLFWKEDVFASPNPDLAPEKSQGYEAGIDFHADRFGVTDLRLARFETLYDDLIIWRRWGGDKFKPLNLSRAHIEGWEISFSSRPMAGPIIIFWNGSFLRPQNREDATVYYGKYLTFRPIGTQNAGIEYQGHGLKASLAARHIGRRYITEENTKSLGPVDLIDVGLEYDMGLKYLGLKASFDILNIGDIQYEILERQPERPREYRFKLELYKKGN